MIMAVTANEIITNEELSLSIGISGQNLKLLVYVLAGFALVLHGRCDTARF